MTDRALQHRRVHNLLLIQKLLAVRGDASPFTLVLDSVEQSAKPLLAHYISNAKTSKTEVIYISYETPKPPNGITTFIKARRKDPTAIQKEISSHLSSNKPTLLILDTLHPLLSTPTLNLPPYLSTLLTPSTTLLAIHHTDIPLPSPPSPYTPPPLPLLRYLATTILTPHSLAQTLSRQHALERSLPPPLFGLGEEIDGVVMGRGANDRRGCVVQMEHRRKSGRGVEEMFFFPGVGSEGRVCLLDEHPLYRRVETEREGEGVGEEGVGGSTFELGLTEKQRREREGVVLPYFDAQKGGGGGEGGRILYDMGVEDDFDEEEDEI